jgi:ribosomal protein S18 acetylase RimI-like enzyme
VVAGTEYSVVERNLRATMRFFGQASGSGEVTERDGMLLIDSGVNYAVFNIAMLTGAVETRDALIRRSATAARYFEERQTRWSLWICDDLLPDPVRRDAQAIFAEDRLRRLTEAPGMIAERLRPPDRALPAVQCRPVADAATRADFAHITSLNFDIPFATCQRVYGTEQAWSHDYHGYIGYYKGTAVTTVAVVIAAESIGIYSVSTLPPYRRKGYAESLMRQVITQYTLGTGIERTVLQATRAGFDMYRKMGYRAVSHFTVYMT